MALSSYNQCCAQDGYVERMADPGVWGGEPEMVRALWHNL